jgi:hypothetical protein
MIKEIVSIWREVRQDYTTPQIIMEILAALCVFAVPILMLFVGAAYGLN